MRIFQECRTEFGQHTRIRRTGILARPKDVEITERDVFQTVTVPKGLPVKLADVFRDAIRRDGLRLHAFDFRKSRRLPISRRRSGEDDALDLQFFCSHQNIKRPLDVDLVRFDGVLDRAWHGCSRGEVQHVFRFVHGFPHYLNVRDAALDESNLVADFRQVVFLAGRDVVEYDHAMAAADEFVYRIRADKAGAARHEVAHSGNPPSFGCRQVAEDRFPQRQIATAAYDASPGKTPGPRFDTLVVR